MRWITDLKISKLFRVCIGWSVLVFLLPGFPLYSVSAEIPNGGFEQGKVIDGVFQPDGWTQPGKNGQVVEPGYESAKAIAITGNGKDSGAWTSSPIPLDPGKTYKFTFWAKAKPGNQGGSVTSGPEYANRDFQATGDWKEYSFVFRVPDDRKQTVFRLGQWEINGTIYFDSVSLKSVQPLYSSTGNLSLGEGEQIEQNHYTAEHNLDGYGSNSCRFIQYSNVYFNTNRFGFNGENHILYHHQLSGSPIISASVEINVNYYINGVLQVYAKKPGSEWVLLGEMEKVNTSGFSLPDSLFPATQIDIKVTGTTDSQGHCNLQIDRYRFQATLKNTQRSLTGETRYVQINKEDPRDKRFITLYRDSDARGE